MRTRSLFLTALAVLFTLVLPLAAEPPKTTAEATDYAATATHADVVAFCEQLAKESPLVRLGTLGTSTEGRKLPLVILADPPIASAEEAERSKKMVLFAFGNIHAGEVDGKEALLMLARDLALAKERPLLKNTILVFAPIFNADGNERFSRSNRTTQAGPPSVGIRANAQGFDLNRDFIKLESPEVRSLARFLNQWDPAVVVDCHTTNGSYHRYPMTYEGGRCPTGDARVVNYVRDDMLPEIGQRMEKNDHLHSYWYGSFDPGRTAWETVLPTPRYSTGYVGLRGRIGILSESYTYSPFKERVHASYTFVRSIFEYTVEHRDKINTLLQSVRADAIKAGNDPKPGDKIALRYKEAPHGRPHELLGYVEETKDGKRVRTDKPKEYSVQYMGGTETTLTVQRPYAYLFPASLANVVEKLQQHGIEVEELHEDVDLDLEVYKVSKIAHELNFQKHQPTTVEVEARKDTRRVPAGTILVRTGQALDDLAIDLLEPQSIDGLTTWNFFDGVLKDGSDFPVLRLPAPVVLNRGKVRPLPEDRTMNKPITFDMLYAAERTGPTGGGRGTGGTGGQRGGGRRFGGQLNFSGSPAAVQGWIDDDHFLQVKENHLYSIEARTGRMKLFLDADELTKALTTLPAMDRQRAQGLVGRLAGLHFNPQRTAVLITHESDLYFCPLGGKPVRLTKSPGAKEAVEFSPDGRFVAYVSGSNLYVVDTTTQVVRPLTTDGNGTISNGKADWVYYEEVFDRKQQAYSWSPDSSKIVFIRFDDAPVQKFTIVDTIPSTQTVETTTYPLAGAPNPHVKLGVVSAAGGDVSWVDLHDYSETASILMRAGWWSDSQTLYVCVQDRAQTWLDFCTAGRDGGAVKRLFRETTKAWVDDPGAPVFLKDGSFLLLSARNGWNHLYHFGKDGTLLHPVTSGEWEVTTGAFLPSPIERLDEENGWVYFLAKKDSPIASDLYRAKLDGSKIERVTPTPGDHQVKVNPKGTLFVDSWSSHAGPTQVVLRNADGSLARTIDTNPVYVREEYKVGIFEPVQIKTADGFVLEGSILKPPSFDAKRRYPVWMMVYGGPYMPTIHDTWAGGRINDEMLAQLGFVVFHVDPRSASGKGHNAAWTAYRQLGVQELKDLEEAVEWLRHQPWADAQRVGISGSSYGGFMTAFALTHSKSFAAGVAAAAVTDWHNYDSVYTERYMNTPQENPDGYNATSVVKTARNLHGKLLVVHGLMDDNVHVQNAMQFVEALERADKDFELSIYPRARHGGFTPRHYQRQMIEFMQRTLRPEAEAGSRSDE